MNNHRTWLIAGLLIFIAGKSQSIDESIPLAFETLFSSSWYERAYNTSMQLLTYHEKIQEMHDLLPEQASTIIDIFIAKLVYLNYCINQMGNELNIPREDLAYLANLINQLKQGINDSIISLCADDRIEIIKQLLVSIETGLNQFISIQKI